MQSKGFISDMKADALPIKQIIYLIYTPSKPMDI
jgi:hypothetical protein